MCNRRVRATRIVIIEGEIKLADVHREGINHIKAMCCCYEDVVVYGVVLCYIG